MSIKLPQLLSTFRLRNRFSESVRWNDVLLKLNGEMVVVYASTAAGIDPFCT